MYDSYLNRIGRMGKPCVHGCVLSWRGLYVRLYIFGLTRSLTSCTIAYTIKHGHAICTCRFLFKKVIPDSHRYSRMA